MRETLKRSDGQIAKESSAEARAKLIAQMAEEKKAKDIIVLDVRGICNFTDFFIISTALSTLQIKAITDYVLEKLELAGHKAIHVDGIGSAHWLVIDYGDMIVHIFSPQARSYYDLEHLWGDARQLSWSAT